MSKSATKAQERVAIKVYKVKDTEKPVISGRFSLRYYMLEIQNPLLVAALAEILKKQDNHLDIGENAIFKHPFRELYFGYDDIVVKHRSLEKTDPANPLNPYLLLLIKLLDDMFVDTRTKLKALRENGLISFKLAWALFPRDTTVISWGSKCELLCKVTNTTRPTKPRAGKSPSSYTAKCFASMAGVSSGRTTAPVPLSSPATGLSPSWTPTRSTCTSRPRKSRAGRLPAV
ncbi:hypothetical protein VTI74DRAFT_5088 [Chaetomium olivicolor]